MRVHRRTLSGRKMFAGGFVTKRQVTGEHSNHLRNTRRRRDPETVDYSTRQRRDKPMRSECAGIDSSTPFRKSPGRLIGGLKRGLVRTGGSNALTSGEQRPTTNYTSRVASAT